MSSLHSNELQIDRRTCLQGIAGAALGLIAGERLAAATLDIGKVVQQTGQPISIEPLTLEQSLRLAGRNMLGILNPEDNYFYCPIDLERS